ncbi:MULTISPECIES: hypothetical protein [unclassified Sinorhizobium]|uniref:hypothetical protein n=1 Tax=unclassified Sinorhizobium TaxID=2613772 RepID=UPI0035266F95
MAEHLLFSEHMTSNEVHRPIAETFLGQAHIAGTGPEGKTCRECVFWHCWKFRKVPGGGIEEIPVEPGYFGKRHASKPLELKKAHCNRPILNKASRLVPHHAKACRLFEKDENPLPARRPE